MTAESLYARYGIGLLCALSFGCTASPPERRPGTLPPVGSGPYASLARCTPTAGPSACPEEPCGDNAVGAPDGATVDLLSCGTLDAVFTGGEIIARVGEPDLALIVEPPLGAGLRVEASAEGAKYVIVGFAKTAPPGTSANCFAVVAGSQILVDLDGCNTILNVRFLRVVYEARGGSGSVLIDALEALSFKPR